MQYLVIKIVKRSAHYESAAFKWLHAISVIIFIFIGSYSVEASEMTFSVKAILPDNQRTKETSYFDLRVAPNQTQKLQIELTNQTANDITVLASANAAITNDNGLADYSHAETKRSVCTFYF